MWKQMSTTPTLLLQFLKYLNTNYYWSFVIVMYIYEQQMYNTPTYHKETNSNGQFLLDFAIECDMVIINTKFLWKKGKLWTHISDMSDTKSQVDYILVNIVEELCKECWGIQQFFQLRLRSSAFYLRVSSSVSWLERPNQKGQDMTGRL